MLAPPITKENAAEYARRATIARENNRKNRNLASNPSHAQQRAAKQVEKVLSWMDKEKNREEFSKLAATLDRLWDKAFPTQGTAKLPRRSGSTTIEPLPTPQEQPTPNNPNTNGGS